GVQLNGSKVVKISKINVKGKLKISGNARKLIVENINQEQSINEQRIDISAETPYLLVQNIIGKVLEFSDYKEFKGNLTFKDIKVSKFIVDEIVLQTQMRIEGCNITEFIFGSVRGDTSYLLIIHTTINEMIFSISILKSLSIVDSSIDK